MFFSALAADQRERAAGVVLSGGDSDGTLGVKAIKERGGLTMAQAGDGYGPQYPDMPESAISGGFVDFAIPTQEMGARLTEFARGLDVLPADDADAAEVGNGQERSLEEARPEICIILRTQTGHEFGGYKARTLLRRVQRRMQVCQLETPDDYLELLRQEPKEVAALFRDLLIGVTNFFRDADAFGALERLVVPRLFEGRGADETIRIWVPGCATGEEVFSIGILLREHMDGLATVPRVQIFASDIDERAIAVARAARYPAALLDSVTPERRRRFFVPDGGSFVVTKEVRDLCIFSPHSVIRDPPFSRVDLISCRNLLIYLGLDMQGQVIPTFHYALRPDGWLFLGTAENVGQFGDLFAPVEKRHRIFRRRADGASIVRLPVALASLRPSGSADTASFQRRSSTGSIALRQSVEGQVLEHFAPAFVVVNRDGDAVYFSPRTGKYLEVAPGLPTRQISALARKGLRLDLRTALREAAQTGQTVVREDVAVEGDDGRVQMITLTVDRVAGREGDEPLYLALFSDQGRPLNRAEAQGRAAAPDGMAELERELRETRERLQSMIEEYETALEEVKSSNEELVSVNEELQSTNEELEASKEELQSVNEELHTINGELQSKIESLDRVNTDLQNLFESTDVATVFLDRNLVIHSFTPAVTKIFNILPSDRGRPITDLSSRFTLPDFAHDMDAVLGGGGPIERRVANGGGRAHYLVRLTPYRDGGQRTKGVVVSFVDVTELTLSEQRQRTLVAELQHRTRNLLTVVQSVAVQTLGKGGTLRTFTDRLSALGRVQGLLTTGESDAIDLAELLRLELRAHAMGEDDRISLAGPPIALDLERIQVLALALHELTTNAVKHGALRAPGGRLEVRWRVEASAEDGIPRLVLEWAESGVAMPADTSRRGSGRELIERALAYELRAKTELAFGADGVTCRIEVPLVGRSAARPGTDTSPPA